MTGSDRLSLNIATGGASDAPSRVVALHTVKAALAMCEGDVEAPSSLPSALLDLATNGWANRTCERLADYSPTEQELAAIGREREDREERIDESP